MKPASVRSWLAFGAACLMVVVVTVTLIAAPVRLDAAPLQSSTSSSRTQRAPVYAYFYQWYNHDSWRRAKIDYPRAGRYSSDDPQVLREQISQAKQAGLDGFLTSWKSTATLNRRLQMLLNAARPRNFDVGVVYEGLDFGRHPLPTTTVRRDLVELVNRWGSQLRSRYFDRPIIIWTGIQDYSLSDIRSVRHAIGDRAYLLASAKSAADYRRVAGLVDGDAYYWSSSNPGTAYTRTRLADISAIVHRDDGIWLAPATAGFDGRPLGNTRVIPRNNGQTLARSMSDAFGSHPDAVGVISWNEWSENTYIEPGQRYGTRALSTLRNYLQHHSVASTVHRPSPPVSGQSPDATYDGLHAAAMLALVTALAGALLLLRNRARGTRALRRTDRQKW